jgi:hypothetical protein
MQSFTYILAQSDEGGIVKFIIAAAFIVITILGQWASSVQKKKEQERRRRVRESIESTGTPATQRPAPIPPPSRQQATVQQGPLRRVPPPQPARPSPQQRPRPIPQPPRRIAQPQRRAGPPPIPPRMQPQVVPLGQATYQAPARASTESRDVITTPARPSTSPARRPTTAASAFSLNAWLKPATLRNQFILTEVFQPPVALRETHLDQ